MHHTLSGPSEAAETPNQPIAKTDLKEPPADTNCSEKASRPARKSADPPKDALNKHGKPKRKRGRTFLKHEQYEQLAAQRIASI